MGRIPAFTGFTCRWQAPHIVPSRYNICYRNLQYTELILGLRPANESWLGASLESALNIYCKDEFKIWSPSQYKDCLSGYVDFHHKDKIFIMGISILARRYLYFETGPWSLLCNMSLQYYTHHRVVLDRVTMGPSPIMFRNKCATHRITFKTMGISWINKLLIFFPVIHVAKGWYPFQLIV